jgi:hypothetical protein
MPLNPALRSSCALWFGGRLNDDHDASSFASRTRLSKLRQRRRTALLFAASLDANCET